VSKEVWCEEWLGRHFININWKQYNRIPEIINCVLKRGFWVRIWNGALCVAYQPGEVFDPEMAEHRFIEQFRKEVADQARSLAKYPPKGGSPAARMNAAQMIFSFYTRRWPLLLHWNWQTSEGRKFCSQLQEYASIEDTNEAGANLLDTNFFQWTDTEEVCKKYKLLHHADWWWGRKTQK